MKIGSQHRHRVVSLARLPHVESRAKGLFVDCLCVTWTIFFAIATDSIGSLGLPEDLAEY